MADNEVRVKITVNDAEATKRLQGFGQRLKEMGERVSFIGSRFTAMFTVPIVGGLYALGKSGAEAAKQVNELQQELNDAIKAGDVEKVAALNEQMKALPDHVRRSARAWNDLQAALQPANDALNEAKTTLLESLVPLVRELAPLLTQAAQGVASLAEKFSNLPPGVQKAIIGFGGLVIAMGPVLMIVGQFMGMIGSAAQLLGMAGVGTGAVAGGVGLAGAAGTAGTAVTGFGASVGAALIPVGLLVAAVLLLIQVLKDFGAPAATAARQMLLLASLKTGLIDEKRFMELSQYYGLTGGKAEGGQVMAGRSYPIGEYGPELLTMGASGGYVTPMRGGRGAGGGGVTIVYSPTISTASQDEIERIGSIIEQARRRRP
jgi:hypothetical protein